VLRTPDLSFIELEQIRGVGRLLDLLNNSGRFEHLLQAADTYFGERVTFYRQLQDWWQRAGLFDEPLGLRQQFDALHEFVGRLAAPQQLREALARDFALTGRVVPGKAPVFFNCDLTAEERERVKLRVKQELERLDSGEKLQHFAALFETLSPTGPRRLLLYLYRSRSGKSPTVEEVVV